MKNFISRLWETNIQKASGGGEPPKPRLPRQGIAGLIALMALAAASCGGEETDENPLTCAEIFDADREEREATMNRCPNQANDESTTTNCDGEPPPGPPELTDLDLDISGDMNRLYFRLPEFDPLSTPGGNAVYRDCDPFSSSLTVQVLAHVVRNAENTPEGEAQETDEIVGSASLTRPTPDGTRDFVDFLRPNNGLITSLRAQIADPVAQEILFSSESFPIDEFGPGRLNTLPEGTE